MAEYAAGKRKREEQSKSSEVDEAHQLERQLISQEMAIADAEAVVQTERNKRDQYRSQRQNEESEVRLVKRTLAAKRAQAEASLESSPDYKELMEALESARCVTCCGVTFSIVCSDSASPPLPLPH